MSASVTIVMDSDEVRLFRSYQKIIDQANKLTRAQENTTKVGKQGAEQARREADERRKAAKEQQDQLNRAAALTASLRTPQEKYNDSLEEANRLRKAGAISLETFSRAQANISKQLIADQETEAKGLEKKTTLLSSANELLGKYGGAAAIATATIGGLAEVWGTVREEQTKAMEALKAVQPAMVRLAQVATGPADLRAMLAVDQAISSKHGVDMETVSRIHFASRSENFESSLENVIAANQVVDPEAAAIVAGKAGSLFGGKITPVQAISMTLAAAEKSNQSFENLAATIPTVAEGGAVAKASPAEIMALNSVLAPLFKTGDVSADRVKGFLTKVGIDAGDTGLTDEQMQEKTEAERARVDRETKSLRAKEERVADLERRMSSARTGKDKESTQIQLDRARRDVAEFDRSKLNFVQPQRGAGRASLAGMGGIAAVEKLMTMPAEQRSDFLGDSQELNTIYIAMSESIDLLKARTAEIEADQQATKQGRGMLQTKMGWVGQVPQVASLKANQIEKQRLEEVRRNQGIAAMDVDTALTIQERITSNSGSYLGKMKQIPMASMILGEWGSPNYLGQTAAGVASTAGFSSRTSGVVGAVTSELAGGSTNIARVLADAYLDSKLEQSRLAAEQARATNALNRAVQAIEGGKGKPSIEAIRIQGGMAAQGS